MKKLTTLIFVVLFLGLIIFAYAQKEAVKTMAEVNPAAELAKSIENGKKLFSDTSLGTSGMTCNSCHLEGGTTEGMKMGDMALPAFNSLGAKYPKYIETVKRVITLDQAVNFCIVKPLKGKALAWDDQKLTDLTAYVASVKPKKTETKK